MITTAAEEILATTFQTYQRVALVASFQAESGVLIDMACRLGVRPDVLTDRHRPAARRDARGHR